MHVAFVSTMTTELWGGSEELWSRAALRLRKEGHDVSASVSWWPQLASNVTALREAGVLVTTRKSQVQLSVAERGWRKVTRRMGRPSPELNCLRRSGADIAIISQGNIADGLSWLDACVKSQVPFVVIAQCNHESFWPNDLSRVELIDGYRKSRRVYCVSKHNLRLLERQLAEKLSNSEIIWNPWNVPSGAPPAWPTTGDAPLKLACVGRLEPAAKGQDLLFEVLSMPAWRERSVWVNLYGRGLYEASLKELARYHGLKNVTFHGHVRDIRGLWAENHLLVLPSRLEGLPLALVESMWCGRPAVVTDVGGSAEACLDGQTGFVAKAPTVALLAEAMERAWGCRDAWESMGKAARRRIEMIAPEDPVEILCMKLKDCVSAAQNARG